MKKFTKACCYLLTFILLFNMLPLQAFATQLQTEIAFTPVTEPQAEAQTEVLREIAENRSEYIKQFALSDGTYMATIYPNAVHYQQDGAWKEIDNTLKANADGTYSNTAGVWDVRFPQQLSGSKRIIIEKDGYTLSFGMAGELRQSGDLEVAAISGSSISSALTATAQVQQADTGQGDGSLVSYGN